MRKVAKVTIHTCDNPECRKEGWQASGEELPVGIYLSGVTVIYAGGSGARDVYACSDDCLVAAIRERVHNG